jgi:hypothetical protein
MLFAVACALADGAVTPASFERGRFRDRDILDLIGRTTSACGTEEMIN